MFPTNEQIGVAAYHLWENRGRRHGGDLEDWQSARKQLTYNLNYESAGEFGLAEPATRVLGQKPIRRCRLCERDSKRASFGPPVAVFPMVPGSSLLTAEICRDCQDECREPSSCEVVRFWESLRSAGPSSDGQSELGIKTDFTLGIYKSLVTSALLILPERELAYYADTLEWVSNPDSDADRSLFCGHACRTYDDCIGDAAAWASLARRIHDDAPLPYMMAFVGYRGVIAQVTLPLCSRDEDLAQGVITLLERPIYCEHARGFWGLKSTMRQLALSGGSRSFPGRRNLVEC